jgi:hypothetical protein
MVASIEYKKKLVKIVEKELAHSKCATYNFI